MNAGVELSMRAIAKIARRDSERVGTRQYARVLTDGGSVDAPPPVQAKAQAILEVVRTNLLQLARVPRTPLAEEVLTPGAGTDADDAVLAAASVFAAVGIPCRVVGARVGHSWTCWLAYQDGGEWVTVDVQSGRRPDREPDERVECDV